MSENRKQILIVEDDVSLANWISDYLISQNFLVNISDRGDLAIELIRSQSPDLVLLDINLPFKDGFEICREVRRYYKKPILMMTARDDELDEVLGLELGADDYITKPIRARALLARIQNLLRRTKSDSKPIEQISQLSFGKLSINNKSRWVKIADRVIEISSNEFDVLWILVSQAGEIVSRNSLIKELRGFEYDGFDRSMDILVSRLRKKLGNDSSAQQPIKTVWGKGYLFSPDQ